MASVNFLSLIHSRGKGDFMAAVSKIKEKVEIVDLTYASVIFGLVFYMEIQRALQFTDDFVSNSVDPDKLDVFECSEASILFHYSFFKIYLMKKNMQKVKHHVVLLLRHTPGEFERITNFPYMFEEVSYFEKIFLACIILRTMNVDGAELLSDFERGQIEPQKRLKLLRKTVDDLISSRFSYIFCHALKLCQFVQEKSQIFNKTNLSDEMFQARKIFRRLSKAIEEREVSADLRPYGEQNMIYMRKFSERDPEWQLKESICIDCFQCCNEGAFANTSPGCNAVLLTKGHRAFIKAIDYINPGEEILVNYGNYDLDEALEEQSLFKIPKERLVPISVRTPFYIDDLDVDVLMFAWIHYNWEQIWASGKDVEDAIMQSQKVKVMNAEEILGHGLAELAPKDRCLVAKDLFEPGQDVLPYAGCVVKAPEFYFQSCDKYLLEVDNNESTTVFGFMGGTDGFPIKNQKLSSLSFQGDLIKRDLVNERILKDVIYEECEKNESQQINVFLSRSANWKKIKEKIIGKKKTEKQIRDIFLQIC